MCWTKRNEIRARLRKYFANNFRFCFLIGRQPPAFFKPLKVIGSLTIKEDGLSSCMEKLTANKPSCFFCQLGRMLRRESEAGPLRSRVAESMGQRGIINKGGSDGEMTDMEAGRLLGPCSWWQWQHPPLKLSARSVHSKKQAADVT